MDCPSLWYLKMLANPQPLKIFCGVCMANFFNKQTLSSKIVIFGLIILLAFLGKLKYSQWRAQQEIEKQKELLQQQADALEKKNSDLNQSLQYLNSPDFKERVA